MYSEGTLFTLYMLILFWMFLGIAIISDIFMDSITVITSKTVTIQVKDSLGYMVPRKVAFWNPTVANLTLMALGSSAPEILLNVIETTQTLGTTPGELGPSTIVGSAAFNLLLISAVSILCVNKDNDERSDEELKEDETPKGIKKIKDLGVFATTTIFSVVAYIWLYVVLIDGVVKPWEAWLTFGFFWMMILIAFIMDKIGNRKAKAQMDALKAAAESGALNQSEAAGKAGQPATVTTSHEPLDFYNVLIPVESGTKKVEDEAEQQKIDEMKNFLRHHFNTDQVQNVKMDDLKQKIHGDHIISRLKFRKETGMIPNRKAKDITKNEIYRNESNHTKYLEADDRHDSFGFSCLNYAVSESSGFIAIKIHGKRAGRVGVRTVEIPDGAQANKDFIPINTTLDFLKVETQEVQVKVIDDEQWEPDKEFKVELFDVSTKEPLGKKDTVCVVLILDDDKPGFLSFGHGNN